VAPTRAEAEDTAACVAIQRLELPVVADKKGALAPAKSPIHRQLTDNLAFRKTIDTGDIEVVFARADLVIEGSARHTAVRLEPRCVLADYEEATGKLTITSARTGFSAYSLRPWASGTDTVMAQIPATALGVAIDDVRVISGDTDAVPYGGGTFGSRAVAIGGEAVHRRRS
jgi:CO/xanthine dehydrogenase Mo-binding subunit